MEESHQTVLSCIAVGKQIPDEKQYLVRDLSKKSYIISNNGESQFSSVLLKSYVLENTEMHLPDSSSKSILKSIISLLKQKILFRK